MLVSLFTWCFLKSALCSVLLSSHWPNPPKAARNVASTLDTVHLVSRIWRRVQWIVRGEPKRRIRPSLVVFLSPLCAKCGNSRQLTDLCKTFIWSHYERTFWKRAHWHWVQRGRRNRTMEFQLILFSLLCTILLPEVRSYVSLSSAGKIFHSCSSC